MRLPLHLCLACCLLAPASLPAADDGAAREAELAALRERIQAVQAEQRAALDRRDRLTRELRATEARLAGLNAELRGLERDIAAREARLEDLRRDAAVTGRRLAAQKRALAEQIRAAYLAGREEKLKLLLNQEDPARLGRMLVYYEYLNQARAAQIERVRRTLAELDALSRDIGAVLARLEALRETRAGLRDRLAAAQAERRAVLTELEASIRNREQRLARLRQDEKALQDLVRRLESVFADIPEELGAGPAFGSRRGRLAWPVSGRLLNRFGARREAGLEWQGVMIAAERGSEVRAISRGRVAYADWLPHYGMLVILEHGDGYMSLYGHNQALYKEPGDWVQAGEVIAAVGDTGGRTEPGLYFEIRKNGRPVDPAAWLGNR